MTQNISSLFRTLPSVDTLLADDALHTLVEQHGHDVVVQACRETLNNARISIRDEGTIPDSLIENVQQKIEKRVSSTLYPVINATGVVIHTNLGRAPLSRQAMAAMQQVGTGYSNLEFDLESGRRGSRYDHTAQILAELTGAEAALVVNNNAAALVLTLSALAANREVVMSRAHLIEIGGGFRIPDIMRQSGAILREVGTTNRTYLRDYLATADDATAMFMRMHTSNFRIVGFVNQPSLESLVQGAHQHGVLVVDDVGSGALLDTSAYGLPKEPMVQDSIKAGADLVLFSGDKLLGAPQAGCIVGKQEYINRLRKHPLARALRVDKTTLAGLDATLRSYQRGKATEEVPIWQMIAKPLVELEAHAWAWAAKLMGMGIQAEVRPGYSAIGGGSLPGETQSAWLLALPTAHPNRWSAALRAHKPAVIARIEDDYLLLDPRTVFPAQEEALLEAIQATRE